MHSSPIAFDEAFSRHRGLLTLADQHVLAGSRVAIAGMGGVGGIYLATLARLGVGKFHICDDDVYDVSNINRQYGATWKTIGRKKIEVMSEIVKDINPRVELRVFPEIITPENVDAFLDGVDVAVDGIDFFALEAKRLFFRRARALKIPVVTAAPIGFGTTLITFLPDAMGFDEYFGMKDGMSNVEMAIAFAVGIAPHALHRAYMDMSSVDLKSGRGPSSGAACALCAGLIATEVTKLVLKRGPIEAAPCYLQYDAFTRVFKQGSVWFGGRNPLQRIKRKLMLRWVRSKTPVE